MATEPGVTSGKHSAALNFRVDGDLFAAVSSYAEEAGVSRSEACRLLLAAALDDGGARERVRESIFRLAEVRRRFVDRFVATLAASVTSALRDAEREAVEESSS